MNRPILVIAAMEDIELNYLITKLKNIKEIYYKSFKFIEGKLLKKDIVIIISNIGLVNAAIATTIAVEKYNPCIIINEGLAGGYSKDIHTGDIVIGIDAINITSMEYKGNGNSIEDYEITNFLHGEENKLIRRKADEKLVGFIKEKFPKYNLHFGTIASGDIWNKNKDRIIYLNKKYGAICEDMEAVSVYTVANLYNIPVIAIKAISNNEILDEKYDCRVNKELQEFIEEFLKLV